MQTSLDAIVATIDAKRKEKLRKEESGQFDIFDLLGGDFTQKEEPFKYHVTDEYPKRERLIAEKEMLGMYVTGHPLAGYEEEFSMFNFNTSMLPSKKETDEDEHEHDHTHTYVEKEETHLENNMSVTTGGIIAGVQKKRTKTGGDMAIIVLEDMYDRIECLCVGKVMATSKHLLVNDALVRIKGRLSIRDDSYTIMISDIQPWELEEKNEVLEVVKDTRVLYYKLEPEDVGSDKFNRINQILLAHPGPNDVKFQVESQLYINNIKIGDLETVQKELVGILGPENIKIK